MVIGRGKVYKKTSSTLAIVLVLLPALWKHVMSVENINKACGDSLTLFPPTPSEIFGCPTVAGGHIIRYLNMLMLYFSPEACDEEHGSGSFTAIDGSVYVGEYVQDTVSSKPHGYGNAYFSNGEQYEGEWRDGRPHGYGILKVGDGSHYEGEFCDGRMHGQGTRTLNNGDRYEGNWRDGVPQGYGKMSYYASGCEFEGEWENGNTHGRGTYRWLNGDRYEGEWKDNKPCGHGVWYSQLKACEVEWEGEKEFGNVTYSFSNAYTWWVEGGEQGDVPATATILPPELEERRIPLRRDTQQGCRENLSTSLELYLQDYQEQQHSKRTFRKAKSQNALFEEKLFTSSAEDALYFLLYAGQQPQRKW